MIWSRTSSSPVEICVTSTFLRHAFLPFLLDCLYCAGAASVVAMVRDSVVDFQFVDPRKSKSSEYSKNVLARAPILGKGRGRSLAANGSSSVNPGSKAHPTACSPIHTPPHPNRQLAFYFLPEYKIDSLLFSSRDLGYIYYTQWRSPAIRIR